MAAKKKPMKKVPTKSDGSSQRAETGRQMRSATPQSRQAAAARGASITAGKRGAGSKWAVSYADADKTEYYPTSAYRAYRAGKISRGKLENYAGYGVYTDAKPGEIIRQTKQLKPQGVPVDRRGTRKSSKTTAANVKRRER